MSAYLPPALLRPTASVVARTTQPASRLPTGRRNALVQAHLPLVRSVVARFGSQPLLPFDDLVQVGSLGLIKAVEAFDPNRSVCFSSFAVPYIRGALLHELRDRQALVRVPRSLWDLRQRSGRLQEERRREGEAPLAPSALAAALGCGQEQLLEVEGLRQASLHRSLDAPLNDPHGEGAGGAAAGAGGSLLDSLADPRTLEAEGRERQPAQAAEQAERAWLRQRLAALDPQRRALLEGRLRLGCSWVELGQRLGMHPRMAQRRCDATLAALQEEARLWRAGGAAAREGAGVGADAREDSGVEARG